VTRHYTGHRAPRPINDLSAIEGLLIVFENKQSITAMTKHTRTRSKCVNSRPPATDDQLVSVHSTTF